MTDIKQTTFFKKDCHTGNTTIYTESNGSKLMIGGWNNGAHFDTNTHVIDLTGAEHKWWDIPLAFDDTSKKFLPFVTKAYAGWLSLPFPDYGIPKGMTSYEQWYGVAMTIRDILRNGTDVLVACHGGHGRSGLFCAIVGYILGLNTNAEWKSPVQYLRTIHCLDAVETIKQEQYVYAILGLRISIDRTYYEDFTQYDYYTSQGGLNAATTGGKVLRYTPCPICGTSSMYAESMGMCLGCQKKYEHAPTTMDLTLEQTNLHGTVAHKCNNTKCFGIWKAAKCQHVTHDKIIYEGYCEECWTKYQDDIKYAEQILAGDAGTQQAHTDEVCAMCQKNSINSNKFGLCYDCQDKLQKLGAVDEVHNSITDPYKFVAHSCTDEVHCVGIIRADVCGHIVHNREVDEGLCPVCYELKKGKRMGE